MHFIRTDSIDNERVVRSVQAHCVTSARHTGTNTHKNPDRSTNNRIGHYRWATNKYPKIGDWQSKHTFISRGLFTHDRLKMKEVDSYAELVVAGALAVELANAVRDVAGEGRGGCLGGKDLEHTDKHLHHASGSLMSAARGRGTLRGYNAFPRSRNYMTLA